MSQAIPQTDMSNLTVGATGNINMPSVTSDKGYTLILFNESGCGLKIQFLTSGDSDNVPAGAWRTYTLSAAEERITWTVIYVLPGAPVSLLLGTIYLPGEKVPAIGTLGNSPIGIGGSVSTSGVQTLSNESSVLGSKVIDIGTLTIGDLLDIFNDHFLWKVQQSGVAHQVLAGNTSGNPLQIGQAGDISEVVGQLLIDQLLHAAGNLQVDGTSTLTGDVTQPGNLTSGAVGKLLHALGALTVDGASTLTGDVTQPGNLTSGAVGKLLHALGGLTVDQIATFTGAIKPNIAPTTINGATAGSMSMYPVEQGTIKVTFFTATTTLNQGSTDINFTLPVAYTVGAIVITSLPWAGVSLVLANVVQATIHDIAHIGTGGTTSRVPGQAIQAAVGGFDTVRFIGLGGAAPTGGVFIVIGI